MIKSSDINATYCIYIIYIYIICVSWKTGFNLWFSEKKRWNHATKKKVQVREFDCSTWKISVLKSYEIAPTKMQIGRKGRLQASGLWTLNPFFPQWFRNQKKQQFARNKNVTVKRLGVSTWESDGRMQSNPWKLSSTYRDSETTLKSGGGGGDKMCDRSKSTPISFI